MKILKTKAKKSGRLLGGNFIEETQLQSDSLELLLPIARHAVVVAFDNGSFFSSRVRFV